ncbi:MAG: hypothetical protein GY816_07270 [Cytophagales bacterium]|nr:hypothetical protein [Cytophagales bacterium]
MNKSLLISLLFCAHLFSGCAAQKSNLKTGILKGAVGIYQGNCMPSPGIPPCKPTPISTTVFITQPAEFFQVGLLVDSVVSKENGQYQISLSEGTYSLFLRDDEAMVCSETRCNIECFCNPVNIINDSTTQQNLNLDHASW